MPRAEDNTAIRSEGYGQGAPLNEAQATTGGPPQAAPIQAVPEPQVGVQGDMPQPEKPAANETELSDGTPLNLDEVLFGPTQRPAESVLTPQGGPSQGSLADLLDAMHASSPAPDIGNLASLARRLGM